MHKETQTTPLIFELSRPGSCGYRFPRLDTPSMGGHHAESLLPTHLLRKKIPPMPEVSENEVVRHFTGLASKSFGVDYGFYPLGSCTMKYNPRVNETVAALPGFNHIHPLQPIASVQGTLELMYDLTNRLAHITGMQWGSLQPFAGAHGEYTALKLFKRYFKDRGEEQRKVILVPTSAHGTNPASAHIAGFTIQDIPADSRGLVDITALEPYLNEELAGIMLTNPNTLGLFERDIVSIADKIHSAGGLLYYDGANLNAIMGKSRPGDMGFDVIHLNLHKTFSTPHGGGGPGAGPIFVQERLKPYLPTPDVVKREDGTYALDGDLPKSIGRVSGFYGNIGVLLRAYTYILVLGSDGLQEVSEMAVLAANYLRVKLEKLFRLPYKGLCKHEFVLSADTLKAEYGITALDVAKGLLDFKIHPPTIYFPLIVPEALMVEPTETENLQRLDGFVAALQAIVQEGKEQPELLHSRPLETPVSRVDEVLAARVPVVCWEPKAEV